MIETADAVRPLPGAACKRLKRVALLHGEAHTVVMKTRFQNSPQRWGLRLLAVLSLNLAGQSLAFAQEEKLYYFVDEHGVPHLAPQ